MGLMDEKGRLFGKVNLLDLVVVVAVLLVAGRFGWKAYQASQVAPTGVDKAIAVTMRFSAVAPPTMKFVEVGTDMYDSKSNGYLGKVVEVKSEPARVVSTSEDGRTFEHISSDRFDYYVTVQGNGHINDNGVTLGGYEMKIGRVNYLKTREWSGYGTTWDMNLEPPAR